MNNAVLAKIVSLVPQRVARRKNGSRFGLAGQGAQIAHLAPLLHWRTPLDPLSEAAQRSLGLLVPHVARHGMDEDGDSDLESDQAATYL